MSRSTKEYDLRIDPANITASQGPLLKPGIPYEMQTIDVEDLAMLLGRSARTIHNDIRRRPLSMPPTFRPPGTKKIRFKTQEVIEWMEELANAELKRRNAIDKASKQAGYPINDRYRSRDLLKASMFVLPESKRDIQ